MTDPVEQLIAGVLAPDERLIWAGRPDVEALVAHRAGVTESTLTSILRGPRSGQLLPVPQLRPWADSLTYAITDRRLLILEGNVITDAYTPEFILLRDAPRLLSRGPDHGDVVFESSIGGHDIFPHAPHPEQITTSFDRVINRERGMKAFKALADAETVRQLVEDWLRGRRDELQQSLSRFIGRTSDDDASACQCIRNRIPGLTIVLPSGLDIRVRKRAYPSGTLAAEEENWHGLDEADDWNMLEARAKLDFHVELELMETPQPTLTAERLRGGFLTRLVAGKLLAVREDMRRGSFRGFSVTRLAKSPMKSVLRQTALYDGRRQLYVQCRWAERVAIGDQACDAIIDSLQMDD